MYQIFVMSWQKMQENFLPIFVFEDTEEWQHVYNINLYKPLGSLSHFLFCLRFIFFFRVVGNYIQTSADDVIINQL